MLELSFKSTLGSRIAIEMRSLILTLKGRPSLTVHYVQDSESRTQELV